MLCGSAIMSFLEHSVSFQPKALVPPQEDSCPFYSPLSLLGPWQVGKSCPGNPSMLRSFDLAHCTGAPSGSGCQRGGVCGDPHDPTIWLTRASGSSCSSLEISGEVKPQIPGCNSNILCRGQGILSQVAQLIEGARNCEQHLM